MRKEGDSNSMQEHARVGILLVNTGTPSSPEPRSIRKYLSQFLMNKRIAPIARGLWWPIVHICILPIRGKKSAEKYRLIWEEEGSPLQVAHNLLTQGLNRSFHQSGNNNVILRYAMSFGEPSVLDTLRTLRDDGCDRLLVLPLYPQSAYTTTGIVHDEVEDALGKLCWDVSCHLIDNYHDSPVYIRALAARIRQSGFDPDSDDKLLFSYHSIPLNDIEAGDTYELQCGATSLQIAGELGIDRKRWTLGYQCRFDKGREWLNPFSRDIVARWATTGDERVFIVCPNFAVDCLETLYDIEYELKPEYLAARSEAERDVDEGSFIYVPCLDRSKAHVIVLEEILKPYIEIALEEEIYDD